MGELKRYNRNDFKGNNTLESIIVRLDFLTIEEQKIENIVGKVSEILGDEYKYRKINNYDINLNISDPEKLITQDFIEQKIDMKNNFEFSSQNDGIRFVINQNFFLYERKDFNDYAGSNDDTELYLKLLKEVFKFDPKIQRLGIRKFNSLYIEKNISKLKQILKDNFLEEIDSNMESKYQISYTPLEKDGKNGYNLNKVLDYGTIKEQDGKSHDVYRYIIDVDSYIRKQQQIDSLEEIETEILNLKQKDFDIYIKQLKKEFLDIMTKQNKVEFESEIKNIGIIHGAKYGKKE